jgi:hypothetical protein
VPAGLRAVTAGRPIEDRTYPEARHGFDAQELPPFVRFGNEIVGYNAAAADTAARDIDEFMNKYPCSGITACARSRYLREEMDAVPFLRRACQSRTGSSAIGIVLLGAPKRSVGKPAAVGSATWLSYPQPVARDFDFGGPVGPLRRRGEGVGDPAPDLIQRIHHVPHRYRGLLQ